MESEDTDRFIRESNLNVINEFVHNNVDDPDEIQDSTMEDKCSDINGLGESLFYLFEMTRSVKYTDLQIRNIMHCIQVRTWRRWGYSLRMILQMKPEKN